MTPQEAKARFFGLYPNAIAVHKYGVKFYLTEIDYHSLECNLDIPISECHLILKPLSEITDEDFKEVASRIMKGEIGMVELRDLVNGSGRTADPKFTISKGIYDTDENGDYWALTASLTNNTYVVIYPEDMTIAYRWEGEAMPVDSTAWVIDFLRSKGYCLPYMGFNPITEGWAILETQAKTTVV